MATVSPERLLAIIELQNAIAATAMNADEVMAIVVDRAAALTGATAGILAIVEGDELVIRAASRPSTAAVGSRHPRDGSVLGRCIADRAPLAVADAAADPQVEAEARQLGAGALACVPLLYGESAVGALEVIAARPRAFSPEDLEALRLLAQIVAIALHRAYTYPKPRLDNLTDAVTGLGIKRAFDERLEAELTRNRRYKHSFSLAVLDLAGVETAVDRLGQAAGDEALREIAAILRGNTRAIDGAFRIAAADFAIVMPGTSLPGARIVAERCQTHIHDAKLFEGTLVASYGIVEAGNESPDDLVARAIADKTSTTRR